jgi:hypothetical protein
MQNTISRDLNEINTMEKTLPQMIEEQDSIKSLLLVAPLIQTIMPLDCMIGITDTNKFINILYGEKIKLDVDPVGLDVPEQDAIALAMRKDTIVDMIVPKEAFGIEFRALALPLKDKSGMIFGGLGIGFDLENSLRVNDMSQPVAVTSQQTSSAIEELAASASELANFQANLQSSATNITDKIDEINEILQFINNIASTSNMIGLNATIEAAKAGESGKGFSVVASEIRKMADASAKSVTRIKETIQNIKDAMSEINTNIEQTVYIGHQQAAATEEITASTQELAAISEELKNASRAVIG